MIDKGEEQSILNFHPMILISGKIALVTSHKRISNPGLEMMMFGSHQRGKTHLGSFTSRIVAKVELKMKWLGFFSG